MDVEQASGGDEMKLNDPRINWGDDFSPPIFPVLSSSGTPGIMLEHQYDCLLKSVEVAIKALAEIEFTSCDFPQKGYVKDCKSVENAQNEKLHMMHNLQEVRFYALDILHSVKDQLGR
jgi:hypothetical protein